MSEQRDLFEARKERDLGMERAADHAERDTLGWGEQAYDFLVAFARENPVFISEDVSGASKLAGFPQPPTDRAWGSIYVRAVKRRIIERDGTGRSSRRHASICPKWRSLVFLRSEA